MKDKILEISEQLKNGTVTVSEAKIQLLNIFEIDDTLKYSEQEVDFAYLAGVFNVSGLDGMDKEIERLIGLEKNPHDIIISARKKQY